jgi:hypothetical protein
MILKGIRAVATWRKDAKRHYNAANGDLEAATAAYKEDLRLRSIDPMTIMVLIQLAIKIWKWAKDNGYLTAMPEERLAAEPSTDELMVGVTHPDGPE